MKPAWLALFAPLPEDAVPVRKSVLPPELADRPGAEAIAGWESLAVHLSDAGSGLRHVLVTLDETGRPISASDGLMRFEEGQAVHENVGGRLEPDGSFKGTRWRSISVEVEGSDDAEIRDSTPSAPSEEDVRNIKALVAEMLRRSAAKP